MPKPTDDPQLEQRVAALEQHAGATDAAIADLDARVLALENAVTTPTAEPPDGT